MTDLFSDAARSAEAREARLQRARIIELLEAILAALDPDERKDDDD